MTPNQLRNALKSAAETLARYTASQNRQVAIFSDGSTSGILDVHSYEEAPKGHFEVCRLSSWRDISKSDAWNARALKEDIKNAIERGIARQVEYLAENEATA